MFARAAQFPDKDNEYPAEKDRQMDFTGWSRRHRMMDGGIFGFLPNCEAGEGVLLTFEGLGNEAGLGRAAESLEKEDG